MNKLKNQQLFLNLKEKWSNEVTEQTTASKTDNTEFHWFSGSSVEEGSPELWGPPPALQEKRKEEEQEATTNLPAPWP
jgi:hypothetical protein